MLIKYCTKMSSLRKSSNTNSSSFQLCQQTPICDPIYCALFEFQQGSQPRVVWRYGEMDEKVESDFVWYIISVPSIVETQNILPKPTFITSTYDSFSYSAVYAQIPDIEARGFSRSICLVIVSKKEEIIFAVRSLFYTEFGKVIDAARENAAALFLSEIDAHIESLTNNLNTAEIKDDGQKIKLERLKEIRETMFDKITKRVPFSKERCMKNALLFINEIGRAHV